jgi:hypothetical protein
MKIFLTYLFLFQLSSVFSQDKKVELFLELPIIDSFCAIYFEEDEEVRVWLEKKLTRFFNESPPEYRSGTMSCKLNFIEEEKIYPDFKKRIKDDSKYRYLRKGIFKLAAVDSIEDFFQFEILHKNSNKWHFFEYKSYWQKIISEGELILKIDTTKDLEVQLNIGAYGDPEFSPVIDVNLYRTGKWEVNKNGNPYYGDYNKGLKEGRWNEYKEIIVSPIAFSYLYKIDKYKTGTLVSDSIIPFNCQQEDFQIILEESAWKFSERDPLGFDKDFRAEFGIIQLERIVADESKTRTIIFDKTALVHQDVLLDSTKKENSENLLQTKWKIEGRNELVVKVKDKQYRYIVEYLSNDYMVLRKKNHSISQEFLKQFE